MAVDTALRRRSAIHVGLPIGRTLPFADGTVGVEDRYVVGGVYGGIIAQPPQLIGQVPNFSVQFDTGTYQYEIADYFSGASSYAIDPAVEVGWTFNTSTGQLTIDTDDEATFGPYTVTATNPNGNTDSNAFTVKVSTSTIRLSPLGPRGRLQIGLSHGRYQRLR